MIAEDVTELQLGAEVVLAIRIETHPQRTGFQRTSLHLVMDPNIIAHGPLAVRADEVLEERSLFLIFQEELQSPLAVVVVLPIEVSDRLSLHVGLPSQNEDLHRRCWLSGAGHARAEGQYCHNQQQAGSHSSRSFQFVVQEWGT